MFSFLDDIVIFYIRKGEGTIKCIDDTSFGFVKRRICNADDISDNTGSVSLFLLYTGIENKNTAKRSQWI